MEDIAPKLLNQIKNDFDIEFKKNKKVQNLQKKILDKKANYQYASEYAIELGRILAGAYKRNLSDDVLPDAKMYYNIAQRIIDPTMRKNYLLISKASCEVQKALNEKSGIGLKAQTPKLNQDRIDGIIEKVTKADKYSDVAWALDEPIVNFSQSVVDDCVRENADFQYNAGLSPKIVRTSSGRCCEWCDQLDGVYDYATLMKNGDTKVFKRHRSCICMVEFIANNQIQNVHSKKYSKRNDIQRRIDNSYTRKKLVTDSTKKQEQGLKGKLTKRIKK